MLKGPLAYPCSNIDKIFQDTLIESRVKNQKPYDMKEGTVVENNRAL